jgi:hypothetical protein
LETRILFQTICFLGYSPIHKGVKCIYIPTGRVYISRDVIFDQNIFPIASLHSNAGARLRSELTLLPPALVNPNIPDQGGEITDDHVENGTNPTTNGLVQILLKTMQEIAMKYKEHKCWNPAARPKKILSLPQVLRLPENQRWDL